jgi:glutamine synthetase
MKDSLNKTSLFTQIKEAINRENYNLVSELQKTIYEKMDRLRDIYTSYRKNLLD